MVTPDVPVAERQLAARKDAPVVLHSARGSKEQALLSFYSVQARQEALYFLEKDTVARSSIGSRDALPRSWISFHDAWFASFTSGGCLPAYSSEVICSWSFLKVRWVPLASELFLEGQGGAFKLGFHWSDALQLAVRKATTSITRGIGAGSAVSSV